MPYQDFATLGTGRFAVIDSCTIVNFLLETENYNEQVGEFFQECSMLNFRLFAPAWCGVEADCVIRKLHWDQKINLSEAQQAQLDLDNFPFDFLDDSLLRTQARIYSDQLRQKRIYDGMYLSCARKLGCGLWTADKRLVTSSVQIGISNVHDLTSYSSGTLKKTLVR